MKDKREEKKFSSQYLFWDSKRLQYRPVKEKEESNKLEMILREECVLYETFDLSDVPPLYPVSPHEKLAQDRFLHKILLPENIMYIEDTGSMIDSIPKSKLYLSKGEHILSSESTRNIMARWFAYNRFSYDSVRIIGKYIGITQNCPYVLGNQIYIPEKGSSRGSTSWIALHHVSHYEPHAQGVSLFFPEYGEIISPISYKTFEKQIERAALLFYFQTLAFQAVVKFFPCTLEAEILRQNILVNEWLRKNASKLTVYDLEEAMLTIYAMKLCKRLKELMGEDNPLAEELLVKLQPLQMPFKWFGF